MSAGSFRVAIAGNPNVGKTSLFNHLTASRYRVGNYPGVTVESREGGLAPRYRQAQAGAFDGELSLVDLPGSYSLAPNSEDELIAYRCLAGRLEAQAAPDAVLVVLDATNLARNLYFLLQIRELGLPCIVALNMVDEAKRASLSVDPEELARELGMPVVPTIARDGVGLEGLVRAIAKVAAGDRGPRVEKENAGEEAQTGSVLEGLLERLSEVADGPGRARWLLSAAAVEEVEGMGIEIAERAVLDGCSEEEIDAAVRQLISIRYAKVDAILAGLEGGSPVREGEAPAMERSRKIDRLLTHSVMGPAVFLIVMALIFQSIFSWADPLMGLIETWIGGIGEGLSSWMGPGLLTDLLVEGVVGGVGNVVVFVPQIALLFLFIGVLEDSGYMARAAFIIDRLMSKVGLHGRAFVPLLSGYACSIPAILSTRTISSVRDRLVTILMIPFMSCSARLPIYALVIAALFEADRPVWGPFTLGGTILLSLYLLSTISALAIGALYKRTILRSPTPPLVLELPPYRLPRVRNTLRQVYDRSMDFLRDAGTVILASTIVLWGLLTFPRVEEAQLEEGKSAIEYSVGGKIGKAMEPALEPMGQDWRVGIGILGSFAAREVMVSTLGLVYGIEGADEDDTPLREVMREASDPGTGDKRYSPLSGVALMIFFVYACQCMSTLAVVKRETGGWKWPLFMFGSMTAIAYVAAVLVFQVGRLLGW